MCFFCQAEDGIRDLVRSRGLGDVYKRQPLPLQQTAITLPFRWDAQSPLVGLKTLNYLPQVLGRQAALAAGADEGIFLNHTDNLVEGCASNLFWLQDNLLYTPALTCGPLPGITRAIVLTLASALGLSVCEGAFSQSHLAAADEAFLTNSCLLYTSPSPRDRTRSRMPSSA